MKADVDHLITLEYFDLSFTVIDEIALEGLDGITLEGKSVGQLYFLNKLITTSKHFFFYILLTSVIDYISLQNNGKKFRSESYYSFYYVCKLPNIHPIIFLLYLSHFQRHTAIHAFKVL